jgi:TRAP-type mannitol/chloroaromatic compound transport system permease small subunit
MRAFIRSIDLINEYVGRAVAYCAIAMVLIQFAVVILRYVFSIGFIAAQESIWYLHGIMFMLAAGYTLLHDGHVRIDIFYASASRRWRATIDLFGLVVFLIPTVCFAWYVSWPYVRNSWRVREASTDLAGLPFIYLLKTVILVTLALLLIQSVSLTLKSLLVLLNRSDDAVPDGIPGRMP